MISIALWFLILPTVGLVAAVLITPEVLLFLAVLITPLLANTNPPPIVRNELVDAPRGADSQDVSALFQRKLPAEMSEDALKSALAKQGFKPLPAPAADCIPPGQPSPIGKTFTRCPTEDRSKVLKYRWSRGICGYSITVHWAVDDRMTVTRLDAQYGKGCL